MDNSKSTQNETEGLNGNKAVAATSNEVTLSEFRESHRDERLEAEHEQARAQQEQAIASVHHPNKSIGWWFWRTEETLAPASEEADNIDVPSENIVNEPPGNQPESLGTQDIIPTENGTYTPEDRRQSWAEWINPVPRMNSVVSYVYAPQGVPETMDEEALSNHISSVIDSNIMNTNGTNLSATPSSRSRMSHNAGNDEQGILSWFNPWSYFGANTDDKQEADADSMYSSKDSEELAKDAKKAIESNHDETRNSSWAFWSNVKNENGQLAVAGTGSEFHPARVNNPPVTYAENQESQLKPIAPTLEHKSSLVLPDFDKYSRRASLTNRTRIMLSSSKLLKQSFGIKQQTHLYRSPAPKPIKKAIVIGIHGFFPIKMVRTLIGHPTGTSMKFATKATEVLNKYALDNNMDIEIETIALEGEGKIIERVDHLLKLLDNWMHMIRRADFIYIASHSQGVMVSLHLAAELIIGNHVSPTKTKIGMLNMCGVCCGPIVGLDSKLIVKAYSKFENEILMELFDFQDATSYQSVKLLQSIRTLVSNNVTLTFVGSINDQLSPLYSSLYSIVNHPNIRRGLFIDKNTTEEIPDFLIKLVNACIISQNMGYSDSDLLLELSNYSSGSLTNGGHSKVYYEDEVYLLGIRNALELDDLVLKRQPRMVVNSSEFNAKSINKNPYHLPWCLRGFVDDLVRIKHIEGGKLKEELLAACESWNPQSKLHKDLKYCVECICQQY